jgi:type I restriction enzyme, S subunit
VNDIPPMVSLTDLAELNPTLPDLPEKDAVVSFVPMSAVDAETASVTRAEDRRFEEVSKGYTPFLDGDVLIAKITPCFENGKIAHARMPRRIGFGSTEFHVVRPRPGKADVRYLLHFLRQRHVRLDGEQKMTGSAGQRRVPEHFIAGLIVPAPALTEQRRIAKILDRAEALRGKRRAALAQLDNLTRSIFLDLFGDPELNPRNWKMLRLQDALSMPLRNGLSPSHAGKIVAKVLTLSAITGSGFDSSALKTSTFQSPPPPDQSVDTNDFLICRGNGNSRLVGKGYFPTSSMSDVTFPDTMIAARILPDRVERAFLQYVWNSNAVRRQVESLARTTNGTFKVNQTMLEGITFIAPPISLQREFALRANAVEKARAARRASLAAMDELFSVLQRRAFRGEL